MKTWVILWLIGGVWGAALFGGGFAYAQYLPQIHCWLDPLLP